MEALAMGSGIVGILIFAWKALSAIDELRHFTGEFSEQAARQFLHDVEVTSAVPLQAKARNQYSMRRMRKDKPGQRSSLESLLTAFSRSARAKAHEKLQSHQENINTTLSILGRHFDLVNARQLEHVDETVSGAFEKQSNDVKSINKQLSELSSSISSSTDSNRAQNSATSQKLDTITKLLHLLLPRKSEAAEEDTRQTAGEKLTRQSGLGVKHDIEFEFLNQVVASMTNSLRFLYTLQMTELLVTIYAWKTLAK
ncbi:MAG: hypothetical protein Q9201_000028 [Fulgogasparrea decipioides]